MISVVGINWGNEGKGRTADLLSAEYDAVVRCQDTDNAGRTVVKEKEKLSLPVRD